MAKRALLPLFLLFAEADFAWVAANLFAGDIYPELVIVRGLITPFFSPQRQTISCAAGTYNRRGFVRIGTG